VSPAIHHGNVDTGSSRSQWLPWTSSRWSIQGPSTRFAPAWVREPPEWWTNSRDRVGRFVSHWLFSSTILAFIVMNTVVLSLDHHPMDAQFSDHLEIVNFALTMVFVVEMILKLFGLGITEYVCCNAARVIVLH